MTVRFVFVGEGSSDEALMEHIEELCLRAGADEVAGVAPDLRRHSRKSSTVPEKIDHALQLEPDTDLVFAHRDADDENPAARRKEVHAAFQAVGVERPRVAVVPVQETEAWLLLDEDAIRFVAENPDGNVQLDLPTPARVESVANPKEILQETLISASELSGRRLKRFKRRFPQQRRRLIERLDLDGPVSQVPAWKQLCKDIEQALENYSQDSE
jgi:hypothetical protein